MPLVVKGYRELMRGLQQLEPDSRRELRKAWHDVGEVVRVDASQRFAHINARSAAGFRTSVLHSGVNIRQSLRKTTGRHPEYGGLQMIRALRPAVKANEERINDRVEKALDRVAAHFN